MALPEDHRQNEAIAAGAVLAALALRGNEIPRTVFGDEANQLIVEFAFLNSPYRITIDQLDQPKETPVMGHQITAKFDGTCPRCTEATSQGSIIEQFNDGSGAYGHPACVRAAHTQALKDKGRAR